MPRANSQAFIKPIDERPEFVQPPETLGEAQKAIWLDLVQSLPDDWFTDSHTGSLERYCNQLIMAREVDALLDEMRLIPRVDRDWSKYWQLADKQIEQTNTIHRLLRSMRLTQQSTFDATKRFPDKLRKAQLAKAKEEI
jgi:hypothetical protein